MHKYSVTKKLKIRNSVSETAHGGRSFIYLADLFSLFLHVCTNIALAPKLLVQIIQNWYQWKGNKISYLEMSDFFCACEKNMDNFGYNKCLN